MGADNGKKLKVEVENSDQVDEKLVHSIEKLQEVQDQLEKVNEEVSDKVLEVEQKYNEIRRPVYLRRNELIKSIPDFWLTAFLSHPALFDLLSEEDHKILGYLESLDVDDFKDLKTGYSISFNFKDNPYFEETKLTKTFKFLDEGMMKITGTDIKWKAGMGPANGANDEKNGNKRPHSEDSFFLWFTETETVQNNNPDQLQDEVAEIIRDDLWPNPLKYFNNEADEDESDEEDDEETDEDAEEDI